MEGVNACWEVRGINGQMGRWMGRWLNCSQGGWRGI